MTTMFEQNNKYPRGSEWKKWDLHLHTPSSFDYNDKSVSDEDIVNKILELGISAVAITDHHQIDISRISNLQKLGQNKGITIFPGIELRTQLEAKENIHLIGIFPENSNLDFLSNEILTKLNIKKQRTSKTKEEKIFCDYKKSIEIIKENNGLVSIHCGKKPQGIDDVIKNDTSVKEAIKEKMVEEIDIFEIGNPCKDITDYKEKVFPDLKREYPLILCSDNHDIDKYYLGNTNYLWIKGDLTFEGLKQIIYEPSDRVKIQEFKPEEKKDYQIIDKVQFVDSSFFPNEILINPNLTAIIGGKSTGKSILLRNIAQSIDSNEVSKRLEEVGIEPYSTEVSDFKVFWKDKQESQKNNNVINKKIIYIPQSYLNRLVDKKEDKTSIDDIIKNVLEKEDEIKNVFNSLEALNRETEKKITQNIEDIFYKEKDIKDISEKIKNIGDKKGIETEIKKLKEEIIVLKQKSGMAESDISEYNKLLEEINIQKIKLEETNRDLTLFNSLKSFKNFSIYDEKQELLEQLSPRVHKLLQNELDIIFTESENKWKDKLDCEYKNIEKQENKIQKILKRLYKKFTPLLEKAQKSKSLNEKIKKIEEEENKLKEIIKQEKNLQNLQFSYIKLIETVSGNHSKFFDNLFNAKTEILKQRSITEDQELKFGINIVFGNKSFQENFIDNVCNLRNIGQFEKGLLQDYHRSDNSGFSKEIEIVINGILNDKLTLKNSYSKKEAITKLTQCWFTFDYKIEQDGDEISEMSPGKKSFVLLKLLIELDNSKCPILLDQPEDDLDNRSIYNDLVNFIKTKKKERQFIIVTHNPNLVVSADSECIVVANQDGDKSKNNIYNFEYVQGALENTFIPVRGEEKVLYRQGIQEHICDILEGGKVAFEQRKKKYNLN